MITKKIKQKYYKIKKQSISKKNSKIKKQYTSKQQSTSKKQSTNKKNNLLKNIYIESVGGFGNKIFDLILSIYFYNLYNKNNNKCIINYVLFTSPHEKYNDPKINNIFIKSKTKINFITINQYKFIKNKHKLYLIKLQELKDLSQYPKYEDLEQHTIINNNFKFVYEILKTFSKNDKDIFTMNNKILTDKNTLKNITDKSYSLVHVRYGDKLHFLKKYINNPDINISTLLNDKTITNDIDRFILYTPEYYIDKINELLDTTPNNMKIYIITDSVNIVKDFIMNKNSFTSNPRIVFLDKMTWWDSFYLLYYASNIILSSSTFCFSGAYFNKKRANCELLIYHHNINNPNISLDEYAISPYWKISNDKKYILNYNIKIAFEILKHKYNWTY